MTAKVRIAEEVPPEHLLFGEEIPMNRHERIWVLCTAVLSSVLLAAAGATYAWGMA